MGVAVRAMQGDVTSSVPTGPAREVVGEFFCVALGAKAPGERVQELRVVRAVGLVALHAACAHPAGNGIVLVDEWTCFVCMA